MPEKPGETRGHVPTATAPRSDAFYAAQRALLVESWEYKTRTLESARAANLSIVVDDATEKLHKLVKQFIGKEGSNDFVARLSTILGRTFTMPSPVRHQKGTVVVVLASPFEHDYALNVPYLVRSIDERYRGFGMTYGTDHSAAVPSSHLPGIRTNDISVIRHATKAEIVALVDNISNEELQSHLDAVTPDDDQE